MKRLLAYMREKIGMSLLAPGFKCLEAVFELFVPLVLADMIDRGIIQGQNAFVWRSGLLLLMLACIGIVCSITAQYFSAAVALHVGTKLRSTLFSHTQSMSYTQIDRLGISGLITRMSSDVNQVQNGVNLFLRLFMRSPFIVFGAMVMAFTVNATAGLVFLVTIPLLSVLIFGLMAWTMPCYRRVQQLLDRVTLRVREALAGVRVIRAFNRQQLEYQDFVQSNEALVDMQLRVGAVAAWMNPASFLMVNAALIFLLYIGAWKVDGGVLSTGQVVALVNYMTQILAELIKLANLLVQMSRALACMRRIDSVFAEDSQNRSVCRAGQAHRQEPERASETGATAKALGRDCASTQILCFEDVSLRYAGNAADSLRHISFSLNEGESLGIIGGTGSGKSSLVNLIAGLYPASEGCVYYAGRPLSDWPEEKLRREIAIVPQRVQLFEGSLRDNLCLGGIEVGDEAIYEALRQAQALDFVRQKGQGLDFWIEQRGRNLSGGQRQRLTIARALLRRPRLLILDDAASALDFATDAALRRVLRTEMKDTTLCVVSQRAGSVRFADKLLVLDEGNMLGLGTHESLLKDCAVYREICASQLAVSEVSHG